MIHLYMYVQVVCLTRCCILVDGTEPVAADDAYEDLSDEMLLSRIMVCIAQFR